MRPFVALLCILAGAVNSAAAGSLSRMGRHGLSAMCLVIAGVFLCGGAGMLWGRRHG